MSVKLVPLEIPGAWAVIHNSFGDEDPVVREGYIVNDEYYNEDLLSIERLHLTDTGWATDPDGYVLDLGWYPASDPAGRYRLILLYKDWNNVLETFESRDRGEIRVTIERYLSLVSHGLDARDIRRLSASQPV